MFFLFEITIFLLLILFLFFYFSYFLIGIFISYLLYNIYLYKRNKKNILYKFIFIILYSIYLFIYYQNNKDTILSIQNGRYFSGFITDCTKNEKNYKYSFFVESYYDNQNKKKFLKKNCIILYSKKELPVFTRILIPKIFFLKNQNTCTSTIGIVNFFKIHKYKIKKNLARKIQHYFFKIKNFFLTYLNSLYITKEHNLKLFQTVFLGQSNMIEEKIKNLFAIFGIQHFLARSGLHIAIIKDILFIIFTFLGIGSSQTIILQCLFLLLFYIFTFQSISFFRAFLMLSFSSVCYFLNSPTTSLHTLSATTIIVLLFWPFEFFNLSTQLTFGATAILCFNNYK